MSLLFPKEQLVPQQAAKNNKLFRKPEAAGTKSAVYHTALFASAFSLFGLLTLGKRKKIIVDSFM